MDVKLVQKIVYGDDEIVEKTENVEKNNIESILEKRYQFLRDYQNESYALKYEFCRGNKNKRSNKLGES